MPSKANKVCGRLDKRHTLTFCAVQKRAHVLKLFQQNTYALPSFSNALRFIAHASLVPMQARACPTHAQA